MSVLDLDPAQGPFRLTDLGRTGLGSADVAALRHEGALVEPLPGVLVAPDLLRARRFRATAAALLLPAGGTVAGQAAAWVLGASGPPPVLDVILTVGRGRHLRPGVRLHEGRLQPGEVLIVSGVRVTSPARTAADVQLWQEPA